MKQFIFIICLFTTLISCESAGNHASGETTEQEHLTTVISTELLFADSPFLITDHHNNSVLSWVEGLDSSAYLYYATSSDDVFATPIKVTPSKGLNPHHESMPKVAFKPDGTVIAVYQRKSPTPENRYAGAIYYTMSTDSGLNWNTPQFLHSDTTHGIGRSFFDICTLPNGEIGAIWLDGRKKQRNGSTLCFAQTTKGKGFGKDKEIGQKTCQCCRTDIFVDQSNIINIAYRDIINDSIRDIVHITSNDLGETFTKPTLISSDNWIINGCPHTGPSMANSNNGLQFFWFTMGGQEATYQTTYANNAFKPRTQINPHARHPQATTLQDGSTILVWDETFKTDKAYINKIGLMHQTSDSNYVQYLTPDSLDCNYPVVNVSATNKVKVSWTQKAGETSKVCYKVVEF
jgi:hypothetical protein